MECASGNARHICNTINWSMPASAEGHTFTMSHLSFSTLQKPVSSAPLTKMTALMHWTSKSVFGQVKSKLLRACLLSKTMEALMKQYVRPARRAEDAGPRLVFGGMTNDSSVDSLESVGKSVFAMTDALGDYATCLRSFMLLKLHSLALLAEHINSSGGQPQEQGELPTSVSYYTFAAFFGLSGTIRRALHLFTYGCRLAELQRSPIHSSN